VLAALLALGASVVWGFGDFLGGVKSRSLPALTVIACSQPFGLAALAIAVAVRGRGFPGGAIWWAPLAAIFGVAGLTAFYRGMAVGAITVVAPIAGAAAVVAVTWGLATGERPSALQEIGFAAALIGVVVTSWEGGPRGARVAAGAGWAALALAGFGGYYVPMHAASHADFLWASLLFRAATTSIAWTGLLALRRRPQGLRPHLGGLVAVGLLDTGGNVFFAAASVKGLVSVVSVLASLYPVVTVLLARVALRERVQRSQELGALVAITGAVLVSAG
jgi:drug/metabolite transporter (DMT)-like permease